MLLYFVLAYIAVSIAIGLYAARRVKSSTDYVVAGRSLPIHVTIATVFATWFGSETVLGIPATFLEEGIGGVISDPFGASMCLILVGLVFAARLYRMKLLTLGDFYKRTYGREVELVVSIFICISYLGWVAAQIMALGLVFNIVTDGAVSNDMGMIIGLSIVLVYTIFGGMWSVAITDFVQMAVITIGLLIIAFMISDIAGGAEVVVNHAIDNGALSNFWPESSLPAILAFIAAAITMGFGSIPQQDVFQRVMSAKDEKTAVRGTVIGGVAYFLFAFIPIFLAYSSFVIEPNTVQEQLAGDSQIILPSLILNHTPLWIQILFFGALLSAILSTASGTLLAPSVTFAENVLKGFMPNMDDKKFLRLIRICVLSFAGIILIVALNSDLSIFEMVENAYKVTLVGAFVPLFAGLYWKKANKAGAITSISFGVTTWLAMEILMLCSANETNSCGDLLGFNPPFIDNLSIWPPQLAGFVAAVIGMIVGVLFLSRKEKVS